MKNILEQLYYGELCPADQLCSKDPEYLPTWEAVTRKLDQLAQPEEAEQLDMLIGKIALMNACAGFTHGLRLGMEMTRELMELQDG